ncbi:MAG: hypothetical protein JJE13_04920 [Thermoleophilia bacterium]|nr:hypothetical protein [Thermoleophilia bacterium]
MSASQVLERLSTFDGAGQSGVEVGGIVDGILLSGIEFAQARTAPERSLRAVWKRRRGNGATPLVLFVDDEKAQGRLLVLGPNRADGQLRSVDAQALLDLIAEVSRLEGLRAVRTFARELGTLG